MNVVKKLAAAVFSAFIRARRAHAIAAINDIAGLADPDSLVTFQRAACTAGFRFLFSPWGSG